MIMNSNLEKIKDSAKGFLYVEPIEDELIPFIIHHPIIRNNPTTYIKNNKTISFDIFENEEEYRLFQIEYEKIIDSKKSFGDICYIIDKPYRLLFFDMNKNYLSKEDYNYYLKDFWITTEFPNSDKNVNINKMINLFKKADKELIMSQEELDIYNSFEDEITVYRGVSTKNDIKALSWTTDYNVASMFANRWCDKNGYVYKGKIDKKDIFAYFDDRNEKEVVVDYRKIKNLEMESTFYNERDELEIN